MKRLIWLALLLCTLATDAGAQKKKNHNLEVGKNLDIFNQLYKCLDLMYVDSLNPGEVIGNGIKGMLYSLDPYSTY